MPTHAPTPTTIRTPPSVSSKRADRMEVCSDLTGHCRELAYHEPISLVIPCEDRVFALEVVREPGAETVATCRPGVSKVSDQDLENLLASPRAEPQPALYASVAVEGGSGSVVRRVLPKAESAYARLGTVFVRHDIAIEIIGVVRSDGDIDPFCDGALEDEECLVVHLEMTNLREDGGQLRYDDHDIYVVSASAGNIAVSISSSTIPHRGDPVVLRAGERLAATVARRIPKNSGEIVLWYQNEGLILFDLGAVRDWSKAPVDASDIAPPSATLKHEMMCGFDFSYAKKTTGDVESAHGYGKEEEVLAICDPDVVAVPVDELNELRQREDSERDGRLERTVLGEIFKDGDLAIRVLAAKRHADGSKCSPTSAEPGIPCVGIELEITNLGTENDSIWHDDGDFLVIDGDGIVFGHGPRDNAVSRYFDQRAEIPPGRRLTTRVARYVPDDVADLMLVHVGKSESSTFLLDENARSVAETPDRRLSLPVKGMVAGPGNWLGNAAPVGVALDVYGFGVRVLEVQRGWMPGDKCCEDTVPSTLMAHELGRAMIGVDRESADAPIRQLGDDVNEYQGDLEYVRVAIEATYLGSPDERSHFNAANLFLVDDERRVYLSGFYPFAERSLRNPEFSPYGHGLFYGLRKSDRVGELFGGSRIEEEIAWLVPRDATGLTLVYVPWVYAAGGFLALEEMAGVVAPPKDRSWVVDAIPVGATSESSRAPLGVAGAFNDEVAVRITEVERFPPPCFEGHSDSAGKECVRYALQIASEPSQKPRSVFGRFLDWLIIDGQEIGVAYDDGGFRNPKFDSFLDWAEINGRGVMTAIYQGAVPEGWREGIFVFGQRGIDTLVYLSLNQR